MSEKRRRMEKLLTDMLVHYTNTLEHYLRMEIELLLMISVLEELGYSKDANEVDMVRWNMCRDLKKIIVIVRRIEKEIQKALNE